MQKGKRGQITFYLLLFTNTKISGRKVKVNSILHYSPILIAVMIFLIQQRIVVTPEQLERKHREILEDAEDRFATLSSLVDLKEQFSDMKEKIDKIYDCIIAVKKG